MALKILKTFRLPFLLPKWNNYLSITEISSRNSLFSSSPSSLSPAASNDDDKSSKNCTKKEPETIGEIVKLWSTRFENEGISEPVESIEYILAHVIGTKKYHTNNFPQILDVADNPEQRLSQEQITKLQSLCHCRMSRMPVQYIIGEWDFRDITLKMVPPVFIPRPETEILVDIVLKRVSAMKEEELNVLDIGCGSGAISLALVHASSKIRCTSIDKSIYACELTRENSRALGLEDRVKILSGVLREDGTMKPANNTENKPEFYSKQYDIIVSNPPYIPTEKLPELATEIKIYEDLRALDGGRDGLNLVKAVMKFASKALLPNGLLFMEVDSSHTEYIEFFTKKFTDLKLRYEHTYKDYYNNYRFVEISKY